VFYIKGKNQAPPQKKGNEKKNQKYKNNELVGNISLHMEKKRKKKLTGK